MLYTGGWVGAPSTELRIATARRTAQGWRIWSIEHDHELAAQEKLEQRRAIEIEYARKSEILHIVHQLLRAHALYEKDVNYVVQEGQVLIVDE